MRRVKRQPARYRRRASACQVPGFSEITLQMYASPPCPLRGVTEDQLTIGGTYKRDPLQIWFGGEEPGPVGTKVHAKIEGTEAGLDEMGLRDRYEVTDTGAIFEFDATIAKVEDGRWMVEEVQ